ncbi:hypothetical protein ABZ904_10600, partial [Streptomyces sp. NPDC046900]
VPHRGAKRATIAVGHSILVAAWHILRDLVPYRDLGPDHFANRLGKERHTRRLIAQLAALGLDVTVTPREGAARPAPTRISSGHFQESSGHFQESNRKNGTGRH